METDHSDSACGDACQCEPQVLPRRDFLRLSGLAFGSLALSGLPKHAFAGLVPEQKVTPAWGNLRAKGQAKRLQGNDLRFIGMPVGGICAGQVYLGGDGRLWLWDIFNQIKLGTVSKRVTYRGNTIDALGGANYVEPPEQVHPFEQGFAVRVDGRVRSLDRQGWRDVSFLGEYPLGFVEFKDPDSPISVSLQSFSPFIPLDADESGLPLVAMRYTLKNLTSAPVAVEIGGAIENPVGLRTLNEGEITRTNRWNEKAKCLELSAVDRIENIQARKEPVVFEAWSRPTFEGWTVTGTAFGPGPMEKTAMPGIGGPGTHFAKSYNTRSGEDNVRGDAHVGRLTSREFTITHRFIEFWIGGGNHPGRACLNLLVDGKVVRTATGRQEDRLRLERFRVDEFEGRTARIEIVDEERGFWGQIGVGQIAFVDAPSAVAKDQPDFGEMALALLDPAGGRPALQVTAGDPFASEGSGSVHEMVSPGRPCSGLSRSLTIGPGKSETVTFLIAWRFPNLTLNRIGRVGNHYAARFPTAASVIEHARKGWDRLYGGTVEWHRTWYDSTLPRWFLDRTMAPTSTLSTMTCVRFGNGRFYGWEGIGCCDGTCGHVWQYAQTVGRLFPSLERSVREMIDFGSAMDASGYINFRGEYGNGFAADSQAGYVLRTLREHQTSKDGAFLKRVYPKAKKALEYLITQDADGDGILEGRQHNTLDVDLFGPSSWLSSLYLAALRAGEEMAIETGDAPFAKRCRDIFGEGSRRFHKLFWNGSYYIHRLNHAENPGGMRIGDGCYADQVMGQGWAWQLGLGRITPEKGTREALRNLFKNNFLPDMGPFRDRQKAGRWYAMPGEAGLLMTTFPLGNRQQVLGPNPTWASMYFNEVWTGCEYEVAGHMMAEGLVDEALAVVRAVHERHSPSRRNPWNEVECSDHYARAMASYGVFVSACGFEYHGPKGHIAFSPKLSPESFRAAFTAAEGWGTYSQRLTKMHMQSQLQVRHGQVRLRTIGLEAPQALGSTVKVTLAGRTLPATATRDGDKLTVHLSQDALVKAGQTLQVTLGA